jgi:osmoprotectant transport system permease protein
VRHSGDFDFGAEFEFFERADAYPSLIKVYPFKFAKLHEMDISLRYKAIEEGKVNASDAFTTDAQIEALSLQVLVDDKHFFPDYEAGIVIREAVLKEYPELSKLLMQLKGKISTDKMRKMNYQLEVLKETPKAIAQEFLATLRNKDEQ